MPPAGAYFVHTSPFNDNFAYRNFQGEVNMKVADMRRAALAPQTLPASLHGSKALTQLRSQQV